MLRREIAWLDKVRVNFQTDKPLRKKKPPVFQNTNLHPPSQEELAVRAREAHASGLLSDSQYQAFLQSMMSQR